MWWADVAELGANLALDERLKLGISPRAVIEDGAVIDETGGPVSVAASTRICRGAVIKGPIVIGADCMIGNQALLRGPAVIGDGARVGFATEIKNAIIADDVTIGPMCFVADSRIDASAYLGAQVRTSNQRLDRAEITVREGANSVATGRDKLGCWIGNGAALGIQVIVLPGRVVAAGSIFGPRATIDRNYPPGQYRATASLECLGDIG